MAQAAATLVVGIGIGIVAIGPTVLHYLGALIACSRPFPPDELRLERGRSLALALEFLLGADILRTAVEPTWDEIARLAAIAAIRTALNVFSQRELEAEAREVERQGGATGTPAARPARTEA